jgi:phosphatidylserine synthase
MNTLDVATSASVRGSDRRWAVRLIAAALSAACAVVYFLIGFGAIYETPADGTSLLFFGLPAGLAFALGAVLLLATDRRGAWILGAAFQVFVIVAYFMVAEKRTPPFEVWGIMLKIAQAGILAALLYLIVRPGPDRATSLAGTAGTAGGGAAPA